MHYDKMFETAKEIASKTGKNTFIILTDMFNCAIKYNAGYMDYKIAQMYNLSPFQRETTITRGISNKIVAMCNPKEYWHFFDSKAEFNTLFADCVKREWYDLTVGNKQSFYKWLENKEEIITKPIDGSSGRGIKKYTKKDYDNNERFYDDLLTSGVGIAEEVVIQHHAIAEINQSSVNTIRIVTLNGTKKYGIVYAYIRIGQHGTEMDNVDCGGMACPIDLNTGKISACAADKKGNVYNSHPESGVIFKDFQIPYFKESKEMCMEASKKIPEMKYIAWDVAITESGPVFIEGNSFPSHAIPQFSAHFPDGIGILPRYREFIDI